MAENKEIDPGIRIPKALRQRIKVHAAIADISMSEYLDTVVPPLPSLPQVKRVSLAHDEREM